MFLLTCHMFHFLYIWANFLYFIIQYWITSMLGWVSARENQNKSDFSPCNTQQLQFLWEHLFIKSLCLALNYTVRIEIRRWRMCLKWQHSWHSLGENTAHHLRLVWLLKAQSETGVTRVCVCVVRSQIPQSGSWLNYSATTDSLHIHFSWFTLCSPSPPFLYIWSVFQLFVCSPSSSTSSPPSSSAPLAHFYSIIFTFFFCSI